MDMKMINLFGDTSSDCRSEKDCPKSKSTLALSCNHKPTVPHNDYGSYGVSDATLLIRSHETKTEM